MFPKMLEELILSMHLVKEALCIVVIDACCHETENT